MSEGIREDVSDGRGTFRRCQRPRWRGHTLHWVSAGGPSVVLPAVCATKALDPGHWATLASPGSWSGMQTLAPQPRPRPAEWESAFERDRGGFLCTSKSEKGHPALLPFFTPPASMKTPSVKRQGQHRQLLGRERPPGPWSLTHSCWVSSSPSAAGLRPPSRLEPRAGPHPASIARFPFAPGRQG